MNIRALLIRLTVAWWAIPLFLLIGWPVAAVMYGREDAKGIVRDFVRVVWNAELDFE